MCQHTVDPSATEWCRRCQPESSGAVAAEKQRAAEPAEIIGRRHRRNFYGVP